jgi:hypothetical protein
MCGYVFENLLPVVRSSGLNIIFQIPFFKGVCKILGVSLILEHFPQKISSPKDICVGEH